MLVVSGGTLLNTLAASTITLALPVIGRDLGVHIDLSRWIMLSFLLVTTVALVVAGRAGDLLGHRRIYLLGFQLFGAMSLFCGLARRFWTLIAGRVLQGVGGAMIMASAPALITTTFPPARRGGALGFLATATYVGLTIGPPLGGWLLAVLSWRWVFYANVPVALAVVAVGGFLLPPLRAGGKLGFDLRGALTLLLGLPLVLLVIAEGGRWGWSSWPVLGGATAGVLLLAAFGWFELRRQDPLLDLRLFRSRVFTGAVISAFLNYVALFVPIILLPFYLLEGLALGPATAGLLLAAQPLLMALVASPAGWLSDRIGTRLLASLGMAVLACGLGGLSTLGLASSAAAIGLWLALAGLGTGIFISPNSSALMGAAPRGQQGIAAAVMSVARNMGMMMGVTAGTATFSALGGENSGPWGPAELLGFRYAMLVAAGFSLVAAVASLLRGSTGGNGQSQEPAARAAGAGNIASPLEG